jgi:hypothetical protein
MCNTPQMHLQRLIDSLSLVINIKMVYTSHLKFSIKESKEFLLKFVGENYLY